jgi:hypothetical protein
VLNLEIEYNIDKWPIKLIHDKNEQWYTHKNIINSAHVDRRPKTMKENLDISFRRAQIYNWSKLDWVAQTSFKLNTN